MSARIPPATPPYDAEIAATLARIMPKDVPPLTLFTTLARNPRIFQRFMAGSLLDKGSISLREREIVIDRVTARCGSEYEWGVHIAFFAERAELGAAEIEATALGGPESACWDAREKLLIRLVDSLHDHARIDAALWDELARAFSVEQLLELIALTGFYHLVSFLTNALELDLEPYAARFPARGAAV